MPNGADNLVKYFKIYNVFVLSLYCHCYYNTYIKILYWGSFSSDQSNHKGEM